MTFRDPRTFIAHAYAERTVDLGEIKMNYAEAGARAAALAQSDAI